LRIGPCLRSCAFAFGCARAPAHASCHVAKSEPPPMELWKHRILCGAAPPHPRLRGRDFVCWGGARGRVVSGRHRGASGAPSYPRTGLLQMRLGCLVWPGSLQTRPGFAIDEASSFPGAAAMFAGAVCRKGAGGCPRTRPGTAHHRELFLKRVCSGLFAVHLGGRIDSAGLGARRGPRGDHGIGTDTIL
jgi:hypothetical protein